MHLAIWIGHQQASILPGDDCEQLRIRARRQGMTQTRLLEQTNAAFVSRDVPQVSDGRQLCQFTDDHVSELRQCWCRFPIASMDHVRTDSVRCPSRTQAADQLFQSGLDPLPFRAERVPT